VQHISLTEEHFAALLMWGNSSRCIFSPPFGKFGFGVHYVTWSCWKPKLGRLENNLARFVKWSCLSFSCHLNLGLLDLYCQYTSLPNILTKKQGLRPPNGPWNILHKSSICRKLNVGPPVGCFATFDIIMSLRFWNKIVWTQLGSVINVLDEPPSFFPCWKKFDLKF